jgi:hypothetical protein
MELDAGAELDATECMEAVGGDLVGGTDLVSGHGRRMECGHDGRRESGWLASGADERSPSRERGHAA